MKLVIFGLSISSSWGNGHATLWRGLVRALIRRGHAVHFFERDVPYYANQRDLTEIAGGALHLYQSWEATAGAARAQLRDADVGIVTSYCPDALRAADLLFDSRSTLKVFYDLDTGVTLRRLQGGEPVEYVGPRGFRDYDLVLATRAARRSTCFAHALGPAWRSLCMGGSIRRRTIRSRPSNVFALICRIWAPTPRTGNGP